LAPSPLILSFLAAFVSGKVNQEDNKALDTLTSMCMEQYNNKPCTTWGAPKLGLKTTVRVARHEAAQRAELESRMKVMR